MKICYNEDNVDIGGKNVVYLFVLLALFCLTVKGYSGKKVGIYVSETSDSFLFNLVRMLFCTLIGFAVVFAEGSQTLLATESKMLLICALSGISNAAFLIGWLLAIQKNSMVTVDVTLTVGSIIPALLCAACFGEAILLPKMIGFALIIVAAIILSGYNKKMKGGTDPLGILFLLFATLGDGLSGFCQQLYRQYYTEGGTLASETRYPKSVYHFYTYVFAAIALTLVFAVFVLCNRKKRKASEVSFWNHTRAALAKPLPHIFVMAVCLFAANYFQTVATGDYGMPSQILYPVIKGGCLFTVTFTAMLFFGERPNRRSLIGSAVALVGIVVMSIV